MNRHPATVAELEERLSRPTDLSRQAMEAMQGDLLILGVGGKMGPSLARLAKRSAEEVGKQGFKVIGVSRFSTSEVRNELSAAGVQTLACDLLDPLARAKLPQVQNVLLMTAFKFGAAEHPDLAWATNVYLPGALAEQFAQSRLVCFSTGNVYPMVPVESQGCSEEVPVQPVGEYGTTGVGRERLLEFVSRRYGTPVSLVRLNYAVELRYGVLVDLGLQLLAGQPIDLGVSHVNLVWQGYANAVTLHEFAHAASPARHLNLTGPEVLSVRSLAEQLASLLEVPALFTGTPGPHALLNNASRCLAQYGPPDVDVPTLLQWTAVWLKHGGATFNKPTKFQVQDGKY